MIRLAALLALALAGCTAPPAAREAARAHPTIVSLNPCTDAILAEITAPGQLLAISRYSKDPRASSMDAALADRFAATGGSAEEIYALRPDLVVASSFIAPATHAAFEQLGLRVVTFGVAHDVAESIAQVRELAELARQPARGEALVTRIEDALTAARSADARAVEAALWQAGGIVPGEGELVADLLRRTGFASYAARRGLGQADYLSLEQVVADPPEVLLVTGQERGQQHPVLAQLPSAVHRLDPALTWCGGPSMMRAVERLSAIRRQVAAR